MKSEISCQIALDSAYVWERAASHSFSGCALIISFGQDGLSDTKPRGLTVVFMEDAEDFLSQMDIAKFHGVKEDSGRHEWGSILASGSFMHPEWRWSSIWTLWLWSLPQARGITIACQSHRIRKSIGKSEALPQATLCWRWPFRKLPICPVKVSQSLEKLTASKARLLSGKVRYGDFTTLTKRMTLTEPTREGWADQSFRSTYFQEIEIEQILNPPRCHHDQFRPRHTELPWWEEKKTTSLVLVA